MPELLDAPMAVSYDQMISFLDHVNRFVSNKLSLRKGT